MTATDILAVIGGIWLSAQIIRIGVKALEWLQEKVEE